MKKEKLKLSHRDLLHEKLNKIDLSISEYSFSNLYLFRKEHDYEVLIDEEIFISGVSYDGLRYVMPTRDLRDVSPDYIREIIRDYDMMFPVCEKWISLFSEDDFIIDFDEADSDYIVLIENLSTYKGKKYHKKRNLLKQFERKYQHEEFPLTEDRLDDARSILEGWQKDMQLTKEETDYYPCCEALERSEELVLCGGIYYVEGEPAGFILGEELNDEVFALHFAKGRRKYKGMYQFIYNNFARIMPNRYCCFNFEQDMGKEALRQAKATYYPECLLKKYRVQVRV